MVKLFVFPDLKRGLTLAILKLFGNIPKEKAFEIKQLKAGARMLQAIRKKIRQNTYYRNPLTYVNLAN